MNKKVTSKIEEMPLESLEDYRNRNKCAREINKEFGKLIHKILPCPEEKHPMQRVIITFTNNSLSTNIPVKFSNADIDYHKTLKPNIPYDLPEVIIEHLSARGTDNFSWVVSSGPEVSEATQMETKVTSRTPRFAIRNV